MSAQWLTRPAFFAFLLKRFLGRIRFLLFVSNVRRSTNDLEASLKGTNWVVFEYVFRSGSTLPSGLLSLRGLKYEWVMFSLTVLKIFQSYDINTMVNGGYNYYLQNENE